MENKAYVGIPKDVVGRIILSGVMAEKISGRATTREEILTAIEKKNIELADEDKLNLTKAFPNIDFSNWKLKLKTK